MKKTTKRQLQRLRVFAAVMTGGFAGMTTMFVLWTATSMDVIRVIAWAAFAFFGGAFIVAMATDEDGTRKMHRARRKPPKYITLKPDNQRYCYRPVEGTNGEYVEVVEL